MYHSITFTNEHQETRNTWDDWRLIPNSRPLIAPPDVDFNIVNVPWSNETLDLTALSYGPRKGNFVFIVSRIDDYIIWRDLEPYKWSFLEEFTVSELPYLMRQGIITAEYFWHEMFNTIGSFLNGSEMSLTLEDDPNMFYKGRAWAEKWDSKESFSEVTISYILEPYKRNIANPSIFSL